MKILCATDFSDAARAAAAVAAALTKKSGGSLRLVHCLPDTMFMGEVPALPPDDAPYRAELKNGAEALRAGAIEVTEDFRRGGTTMEILAAAAEQGAELIVLGSSGKGGAGRWIAGSVAEAVAAHAPVPVLVVREADKLLAWLEKEQTLDLLCGIDLSGSSDAALALVRRLKGFGPVKIAAASIQPVAEEGSRPEQHESLERDIWEKVHAILGEARLEVHARETGRLPASELLRLAGEQKPGMLVVGTHRHEGTKHRSRRSFSRRVLDHAGVNVLCVPGLAPPLDVPAIRRVLLAMNFDGMEVESLRRAQSLLPSGGEIRLLHVCREPKPGINPVVASEVYFEHSLATAKEREAAEARFLSLPAALREVPNVRISQEVLVHRDAAAAICAAAERMGADVICMGCKGHSRLGAALLGSTVQAVLARSRTPVLVVTAAPI